jgi:hypothetical protein
MPVIDEIRGFHDELTDWRRDIHAHPELGFQEQRTSDLVAEKLEGFGIEVHRGIGKTGLASELARRAREAGFDMLGADPRRHSCPTSFQGPCSLGMRLALRCCTAGAAIWRKPHSTAPVHLSFSRPKGQGGARR